MTTLAATSAESVVTFSVLKSIIMIGVLTGWAWIVTFLDKDARDYYLQRRMWNGIQLGGGALAFFLWFIIDFFWIGLLLVLVIFTGAFIGYAMYRNGKVAPELRWSFSLHSFRRKLGEMEAARVQRTASVRLLKMDGAPLPVPAGEDPHAQAHVVIEQMLDFALPRGGNRADVIVNATKAALAVRVDGVAYPQPEIEPRLAVSIIDYLKQYAGMDVEDRRRKQRGSVLIESDQFGRHELTVSASGSTRGLSMTVQIDHEQASLMLLKKLGLLESQRGQIEPLLEQSALAVIVASPPRQGMTSTINSLVNRHDPYTQSIVSLEEESELDLEGVTRETIEPNSPPEAIERRLAAILRSDPAVIMLNLVPDASLSRSIARASADVRFYFGLRYEDTFAALRVWLKAVGDDEMAASGLGAIVAQRLVRKLCPTCRVAYKPDPAVLKKLNLPAERVPQLYKHSGQVRVGRDRMEPCPDCLGMGYRGRVGVFEVMVLDDESRRTLATGQLDQFRAHMRRRKMLYLQESALLKVVEGLTSIGEVTRALAP